MPSIMNPLEPGSESRPWRKDPRLWGLVALALVLGLLVSLPHLHDATSRGKADDVYYHIQARRIQQPLLFTGGQIDDDVDFDSLARILLERGRYESTYRAPGYPAFVALVYRLCGPHPFAVYGAQCLLLACSLPLAARVLEQVSRSRGVGLMTAAATACYPYYYLRMVPLVMSETLALFLVALLLVVWYSALRSGAWWKGPVLGALFAAATLTKAILLPFAGIIAICLFLFPKDRRSAAWQTVLFLALAGLCIAPWTYRNWRVTGAFLPVSTGAGFNFWLGNYPGMYDKRAHDPGRAEEWPHFPGDIEAATQGMNELQRDEYLKRLALGYIREDPVRAVRIFLLKFSFLWLDGLGHDTEMEDRRPPLAVGRFTIPMAAPVRLPLVALALVGAWMLKRGQRARALPVLLLLGWWTAIYVAMVADARYAFPVWPYVFGFASIPLLRLAERFSQGGRDAGAAPAGRAS